MQQAVLRDVNLEKQILDLVKRRAAEHWNVTKLTIETDRPRRKVEISVACLHAMGRVAIDESLGNNVIVTAIQTAAPPDAKGGGIGRGTKPSVANTLEVD